MSRDKLQRFCSARINFKGKIGGKRNPVNHGGRGVGSASFSTVCRLASSLFRERDLAQVICLQDRLGGLWRWRTGLLFIQEKNQQFRQCMVCIQESVMRQFQLSSDHMPRVKSFLKG